MVDFYDEEGNLLEETAPEPVKEQPKKRGRKPACEKILNKYPFKELVYFDDPAGRRILRTGVAIVWDGKSVGPAFMLFTEHKDGTLNWNPRSIRNVHTNKSMPHYDMLPVAQSMLGNLQAAIGKVLKEWFGGQQKADENLFQYEAEKKADSLDDKIKRTGFA